MDWFMGTLLKICERSFSPQRTLVADLARRTGVWCVSWEARSETGLRCCTWVTVKAECMGVSTCARVYMWISSIYI